MLHTKLNKIVKAILEDTEKESQGYNPINPAHSSGRKMGISLQQIIQKYGG